MNSALKIHHRDNVAVALKELKKGETVQIDGSSVVLRENIARGHKFALADLPTGTPVMKYGYPIGKTKREVPRGTWVHSHNMETGLDTASDQYRYRKSHFPPELPDQSIHFEGYRRKDGSVGVRNEIWVIPTVGCVNETGEKIIRRFREMKKNCHADGIKVLKHSFGCSQLGDDLAFTRRILADFVHHPNVGGVLVLSLGCENNTLDGFKKELGAYDESRVRFLTAQESGDEVEKGAGILLELDERMAQDRRETVPAGKLRIGVKCGGSDGLSGITANPLIGVLCDFLVSQGGSIVQTEVPEMFGAESILMNRARDEQVFDQIVGLIRNFKNYFISSGQPVYENPSPGNKEGGITTLEEKSLGCVQKSGSAVVEDVLPYGGRIEKEGLSLLCAPGNDLVSASALAASGCQIILFSTGRGTPFGTVVPTLKISTNTQLFRSKPGWIDFDAGGLVTGQKKEEALQELVRLILLTADGKPALNEAGGFGEIAIWKNGVTL